MRLLNIITVIALLLCLAPMPYGFYTIVRFLATVAFLVTAYHLYKVDRTEFCIACVVIAVLFQPLLKVHLGRTIWNIVDVIAAVVLVVAMLRLKEKH